jgi:hypothetical protein
MYPEDSCKLKVFLDAAMSDTEQQKANRSLAEDLLKVCYA